MSPHPIPLVALQRTRTDLVETMSMRQDCSWGCIAWSISGCDVWPFPHDVAILGSLRWMGNCLECRSLGMLQFWGHCLEHCWVQLCGHSGLLVVVLLGATVLLLSLFRDSKIVCCNWRHPLIGNCQSPGIMPCIGMQLKTRVPQNVSQQSLTFSLFCEQQ